MLGILELTDSTMILGPPRGWSNRLFDSRLSIDRDRSEIIVDRRSWGRSSQRSIPMEKVNSVRMAVRQGTRNLYMIGTSRRRMIYDYPKTRYDLWIDAMELGKLPLGTHYGFRSDFGDLAALGRRVADFMEKPFIDTSKS